MNTSKSKPKLNRQVVEEAAEWFVEFSTGDADLAARQRFDEWLRMSPEHVRAYLEILPIWEDGAVAPPGQEVSPELLIAWAQGADNVVPLDRVSRASHPSSPAPGMTAADPSDRICPAGGVEQPRATRLPNHVFSRRRFATAASILLVCAGGGVFAWYQMYRAPTYATDVGEQRSIVLADGSTIELNARSRVRIRFTEQERDVDLLQGQALFRVEKDHARPFIVRSDTTRVRAVGTQFDVYRKETGTTVTVVEGRVAVLPTGSEDFSFPASFSTTQSPAEREEMSDSSLSRKEQVPKAREAPPPAEDLTGSNITETRVASAARTGSGGGAIFLSAGEQVTVTPEAVARPTRANVAAATAWTQRRLVFDSTPLTEVAEEFNRYNARQLLIRDAGLKDFHISGSFSSTDPTSLLRFLREQPGLSVNESKDEIQISRK